MAKTINARHQSKHDTEANWLKATNFIPLAGEIIIYDVDDTHDKPRFKVGDGSTNVNDLSFAIIGSGDGANSILIGEGDANGKYSIAGGTNDKDLISDLAGDLSSIIGNIEIAKADGDMSMSFGAGTVSRTAGTLAVGANAKAGIKGFYFTKVSGTTLTLSTKQPTILSSSARWDATAQAQLNNWKSGDTLTIVNDANYVMCCKITSISNTSSAASVTVDSLPFTSKATVVLPILDDFSVINHDKPDAGVVGLGLGSISIGLKNEAHGLFSLVEGRENLAAGNFAHAEGLMTKAGHTGHSEGYKTNAKGNFSHAENSNTTSSGENSHAEGLYAESGGTNSHAEGKSTKANGLNSHAEGFGTEVTGESSHVEGAGVKVYGNDSHGEGYQNTITSDASHAHVEGARNTVNGLSAHAEGDSNAVYGKGSHAEGVITAAIGEGAHAEGQSKNGTISVQTTGDKQITTTSTDTSLLKVGAVIRYNNATAKVTAVDGSVLTLDRDISIPAEATNVTIVVGALGNFSHTEGQNTTASGTAAHTEGYGTVATGSYAHAEGYRTLPEVNGAVGVGSHVEGVNGEANGNYSHVEGLNCKTKAGASGAHAQGEWTEANAQYSHAEGWHTRVDERCGHVQGKYNDLSQITGYAHIVGGGTSESDRKNIHTLDWNGNAVFAGTISDKNGELSLDAIFPEDLTDVREIEENQIKEFYKSGDILYCIASEPLTVRWWHGPSYGDEDYSQNEPTIVTGQISDKIEYDYMFSLSEEILNRDFSITSPVDYLVLAQKAIPTNKTTVNREGVVNIAKAVHSTYSKTMEDMGMAIIEIAQSIDSGTSILTGEEAGILTQAKEYTDALKTELLDTESLDETYNTLKEIDTWIKTDGIDTTELTAAIAQESANRTAAINEAVDSIFPNLPGEETVHTIPEGQGYIYEWDYTLTSSRDVLYFKGMPDISFDASEIMTPEGSELTLTESYYLPSDRDDYDYMLSANSLGEASNWWITGSRVFCTNAELTSWMSMTTIPQEDKTTYNKDNIDALLEANSTENRETAAALAQEIADRETADTAIQEELDKVVDFMEGMTTQQQEISTVDGYFTYTLPSSDVKIKIEGTDFSNIYFYLYGGADNNHEEPTINLTEDAKARKEIILPDDFASDYTNYWKAGWQLYPAGSYEYITKVYTITPTAEGSTVLGEGTAEGSYSLVAGSSDPELVKDLSSFDLGTDIQASQALGDHSIAIGTNNISYTLGSMTLGFGNTAGVKGFYWIAYDANSKTVTLSTTQLTKTWSDEAANILSQWSVGDAISVVNNERMYKVGMTPIIQSIDTVNGTLTVNTFPWSGPVTNANPKIDMYSIYVPQKPAAGLIDYGLGAVAIGIQNKATGSFGSAMGQNNLVDGDYAGIFGRNNIATGNSSFVAGSGNEVYNKEGIALGMGCIVTGNHAVAMGSNCKSLGGDSFSMGDHVVAGGNTQFAIGKYNLQVGGSYGFVIGGGSSEATRKNALTVDWNGNTVMAGTLTAPAANINNTTYSDSYIFKLTFNDGTTQQIKVLGVEI